VKLITIAETAKRLRVTQQWLYQLARAGTLPVIRLGRAVRVDERRLREWLADGGVTTKEVATTVTQRDGGRSETRKARNKAADVASPAARGGERRERPTSE